MSEADENQLCQFDGKGALKVLRGEIAGSCGRTWLEGTDTLLDCFRCQLEWLQIYCLGVMSCGDPLEAENDAY